MERGDVLPTTKFAYRKGLGTCDARLCVAYTAKCIDPRQEARIDPRQEVGSYRLISAPPLIM